MTGIEKYAVELVYQGTESFVADDMKEDTELGEKDWRKALVLGADIARAIRANQESFLGWFRSLT